MSGQAEPRALLSPRTCFHGKLHSQGRAAWSFKTGLTFLWKQWQGANQNLILKEGDNGDQCPVGVALSHRWVSDTRADRAEAVLHTGVPCPYRGLWTADLLHRLKLSTPNTPSECREPCQQGHQLPVLGLLSCRKMLDREANAHHEEVSTSSQEEKNRYMETVKIPVHCRCHTTNTRVKLLKSQLKTQSTQRQSQIIKPEWILQEGPRQSQQPWSQVLGPPAAKCHTLHSSVSGTGGRAGNLELELLCTLYLHADTVF